MSAYRTGFVTGVMPPKIKRTGRYCPLTLNALHEIETPVCPYPWWRFISAVMWHNGVHNGTMSRLTKGRSNG